MLRTDLIRPLPELLQANADRFGAKVGFRDAHRSVTYGELAQRTRRLAGHLVDQRLRPGDRAAICLGNRVEMVESYLAIARASGIGVPVNPRVTDAELDYLLDDSGARVVITDSGQAGRFRRAQEDRPYLKIIVTGEAPAPAGTVWYEGLAGREPAVPALDDLDLDSPAWILYTSGTTGKPKGVVSTQRSCLWSVAACYVPIPGLTAADRVVWPLPLFHSLSHIACVLGVTAVGATARIVDGFAAHEVLEAVREESATFLAGVPTMYHYLVRAAKETGFQAPDLRMCLVGGAVTTAALRASFEAAFGAPLLDAYGSTETCGSIAMTWPTGARPEGSCGLPVPGLGVRLVSPETGIDVAPDQEGEVWVRGPSVMLGYHNQPEITAEVMRDGWYRTGDLARRDEAGFFTVTGRIKELIIRGGENIHPGEVEEVLRGVPGVADVAVVGKPHEVLGEVPVAFLVPGQDGLDTDALFTACRRQLSYFKVPEELYEIASIPRTPSGKITRHVLLGQSARLRAAGSSHYDSLLRVDWLPLLPLPARPAEQGPWAVAGAGELIASLDAAPGQVLPYPDVTALLTAIAAGTTPVPAVTLLPFPPVAAAAATRLATGLTVFDEYASQVAAWLADERLAQSRLVLVTRGAVPTGPDVDEPDLLHALVWGLARGLQPRHAGRLVVADLDPADEQSAAGLPAALSAAEPQLALRSGAVLRPRLARVPAAGTSAARLDPRRTVAITGADTAEAAAVARHLAGAYGARHLLLISPRGDADPAAAELKADLSRLGAKAELTACDLTDPRALAAALSARRRPLTAVVHVQTQPPARDRPAVRELVAGALNLHELTAATAGLSAFVLLSPASGLFGAAGQEDRAVAAAFLDALARRRSAAGLPGLSLAWGPWQDAAQPGPAAAAPPGVGALSAQELLAMFDAAAAADEPALVALRLDSSSLDHRDVPTLLRGLVAAPIRPSAPADGVLTSLRQRLSPLPVRSQERELLDLVGRTAAEVAGLSGAGVVAPGRSFSELGFTSVLAVQLRDRLTSATGLRLPASVAFDCPTPAKLASYLRAEILGLPAAEGMHAADVIPEPPATAAPGEPVAIVAAACRFPGGIRSPESLWQVVSDGAEVRSGFPADRGWDLADLYHPQPGEPGKTYVRSGGFLHDAGDFDAAFFGMSPREALATDPQQRLLLEIAWEALERAGLDPLSLRGSDTGVFAGVMFHDYASGPGQLSGRAGGYHSIGTAGSVASGRVAYTLGLEGPAVTVDTACSSSLVALHLAVQALRQGDCRLALAGGVTVMATPEPFVEYSRQRGLAPDGRCKAFAAAADGTGFSEGAALLLLERLSDAQRNGHQVLAVVRGSAINQDGASNGLTAPSGPAQQRVIARALASARLTAADVDAVEAHGTGTTLGDTIEAQALLLSYGQGRPADQPVWLGSLKSNLGHTQAAAGVAGVIKMIMALRHGQLPRTLHVDAPNPRVDWDRGAVRLLTEPRPWPAHGQPRRAGISSFGVSGTNAHVIIEQAPGEAEAARRPPGSPEPPEAGGQLVLCPVFAHDAAALRAQSRQLADFLATRPELPVADVGRALATTRAHLAQRAVIMAKDRPGLLAGLEAVAAGNAAPQVVTGARAVAADRPVFVFPGQGSQWPGMAVQLLSTSPVFRDSVDECSAALAAFAGYSIGDVLRGVPGGPPLSRIDVLQSALFTMMVSLAKLWRAYGVEPAAVVGHSQGEIAAAHVAGALSLADAARIVALRGQAWRPLDGRGSMIVVQLTAAEVAPRLTPWSDRVGIAAVNGPATVAVSGEVTALTELLAALTAQDVRAQWIPGLAIAGHSPQVEALRDDLMAACEPVVPRASAIPFYSTVTGGRLDTTELDAGYWYRNLRQTVEFQRAVDALGTDGHRVFLEMSPHRVLGAAVQDTIGDAVTIGSLRRDDGSLDQFRRSLAEAHVAGVPLAWPVICASPAARLVTLPTYAFQRRRYWLAAGAETASVTGLGLRAADHPLLGAAVRLAEEDRVVFTGRLSVQDSPWLAEHVVMDTTLLPAAVFVELALHVADQLGCQQLEELAIEAPVLLPESGGVRIQLTVGPPHAAGQRSLSVFSQPGDAAGDAPWTRNANGILSAVPAAEPEHLRDWPPRGATAVPVAGFYERLAANGLSYGPAFQGLAAVWRRGDELFAEVRLPDDLEAGDQKAGAVGFGLHPALLDATVQAMEIGGGQRDARRGRIAFAWNGVSLGAAGARALRVRLTPAGQDAVSVLATDVDGLPVFQAGRLVLRPISAGQLQGAKPGGAQEAVYRLDWVPVEVADESPPLPVFADLTTLEAAARSAAPLPTALLLPLPATVGWPSPSGAAPQEDQAAERGRGGDVGARVRAGLEQTLAIVRAWLASERWAASHLVLATSGAVLTETPDPVAAALCGLLRSAQAEHPGRFVLVDSDGAESSGRVLAAAVATGEPQLAVREGKVFAPRLHRVESPRVPALPFRGHQTVLVTGASGGIGRLVARHLAAGHGVAELLLVSRRGAHAGGTGRLAAELAALGARVRVVAADVADRAAVAALLAANPVTAVVHAAGVVADGLAATLSMEQMEEALRAKVDGARHLHELTRNRQLSAFVLFSSMAAVLGTPGQGGYAAANAFLESLARYRRSLGLPATALAWGLWAAQDGMAGRLAAYDLQRIVAAGSAPMSAAQGLALFDLACAADEAVLVPSRLDLPALRRQARSGQLPPVFHDLVQMPARRMARAGQNRQEGSFAALAAGDLDRLLPELVEAHAAAVLGYGSAAEVDASRSFKELGFDSLTGLELRNRLGAATGLRLSSTVVFDYPSPKALAGHLRERLTGGSGRPLDPADAATPAGAAAADEPIAIVGMACRFPGGVSSPEDFWRLLASGGDAIAEFPDDRGWELADVFDPDPDQPGKIYVRRGGFLDRVGEFDPEFFDISPREALAMDPQQRLLLETGWEALERAGIDPLSLRGSRTGVFAGTHGQDYAALTASAPDLEGYRVTSNLASALTGRVAYVLGLEGPAVTVDTACSSSLVALHLAGQALRSGECELALAGAASVLATMDPMIVFSRQRGLAADGRCKSYAAAADGFGIAEGVAMLVVERLADARRRGHQVLAVVRGSAVNQDGASNGLTAPNGLAQQRVIMAALTAAGLGSGDVDAVEGHGTGTELGDPIEAQALLASYGQGRPDGQPLWLGSVKSNIGHAQAAAGLAGVIKMVQAIRHGLLPATLHVDAPSPRVDWDAGQVALLRKSRPWPEAGRPRRAGVSSFGISGTNAHVIIEQAPDGLPAPAHARASRLAAGGTGPVPAPVPGADGAGLVPLVLSAKSAAALAGQAGRLAQYLRESPAVGLAEAGYSLVTTRAKFRHRAVVLAGDRDGALARLTTLAAGQAGAGAVTGSVTKGRVALLFPGQGSQRAGMGRELHAAFPAFAQGFDAACAELDRQLAGQVPFPVAEVVFARPDAAAAGLLRDTAYAQAGLFAVGVGLLRLLESLGVRPDAVAGHSVGELAAAHAAGMATLADAAALVAARGLAMGALPAGGAMVAVQASEDEVVPLLAGAAIAAVNSPSSLVVSGDEEAVSAIAEHFRSLGRRARRLDVSHAFHSPRMEPAAAALAKAAAGSAFGEPDIPVISTVTGRLAGPAELRSADYWAEQVRATVRFADTVRSLAALGVTTFLEVGPGGALCAAGPDCLAGKPGEASDAAFIPLQREDTVAALLTAVAGLHVRGGAVDWPALFPAGTGRADLPTYAFQRQRYWLEASAAAGDVAAAGLENTGHPLIGAVVSAPDTGAVVCTGQLSQRAQPWLAGHRLSGTVLVPGTAFVEMAVRAGAEAGCPVLEELVIQAPLPVPAYGGIQVRISVAADAAGTGGGAAAGTRADGRRAVTVYSRPGPADGWTQHASGWLAASGPAPARGMAAWPPAGAEPASLDGFYETLAASGYEYGAAFRGLRACWRRGPEIFAEAVLPAGQRRGAVESAVHPALLDAVLHATSLVMPGPRAGGGQLVPFSWDGVRVHAAGAEVLRAVIAPAGPDAVSVEAFDETGAPVVSVRQVRFRPAAAGQLRHPAGQDLYTVEWIPVAPVAPVAPAPAAWTVLAGPRWLPVAGLAAAGVHVAPGGPAIAASPAELAAAIRAGRPAPSLALWALPDAAVPDTASSGTTLPDTDPSDSAAVPAAVRSATAAVLGLVQQWLAEPALAGVRLLIATRGAAAPGAVSVTGAAAWGLARTAAAEHPGRFALADLGAEPAPADLAAALAAAAAGEDQLAVRAGQVLVPRLVRAVAPAQAATPAAVPAPALALDGGTVLITGGTGTLGAVTARHLATRGKARDLLLASRSGPHAAAAAALAAALAGAGALARITACDTADRDQLAALVAAAGPLSGVFHAAGTLDDGVVTGLDAARLAVVLAPKADAAWHLHELTAGQPLAAFVLYSSAAGLLGSQGQGNYAAANSFLDALASHRRGRGLPATSLAWGWWAEAGGMGGSLDDVTRRRNLRGGMLPLSTAAGLDLLDASLARNDAVLAPVKLDLAALERTSGAAPVPPLLRGLVRQRRPSASTASADRDSLSRRLAALAAEEQVELLLELVRTEVAVVLGHSAASQIEAGQPFSELGFDSLTAVELRNRLAAVAGTRLPATLIFDYPTPAALAGHLRAAVAPAQARQTPGVLDELKRLESVLSAAHLDEATSDIVAARLRALAQRWSGTDSREDLDLESATDDEMFELLDNELDSSQPQSNGTRSE